MRLGAATLPCTWISAGGSVSDPEAVWHSTGDAVMGPRPVCKPAVMGSRAISSDLHAPVCSALQFKLKGLEGFKLAPKHYTTGFPTDEFPRGVSEAACLQSRELRWHPEV